ncbi:MAG: ribosome-binding factor A [Kiritimatiellia bacterium]
MPIDRLERVNALLRRELAEAFFKVFQSDGLDMAAITVMRVESARNLRNATVYLSIRGHEHERGTMLHKIERRRGELQRLINRDLTLKYTPCLLFRLDLSVEKGDHVLDVLSHLDIPEGEDAGPESVKSVTENHPPTT